MRTLVLLAIFLLILWAVGLYGFTQIIPRTSTDNLQDTDAIVVLTGGADRIREGVILLAKKKASYLFISGVNENTTLPELFRMNGINPRAADTLGSRISAGHTAEDTMGNAREVTEWVERLQKWRGKNHIRSIRLVTSNYHMVRALLEFHAMMPRIRIIPHPVISENVHLQNWWEYPGTRTLILSEYHKLLATAVKSAVVYAVNYLRS
ncbi:MAG: YdcF family protein [Hyphomicrobiales bacterium]|nr:YdcF family protein [Rickettsiales bacterium]MCP5361282.1 YdcF family protein [Hyphomicrobiales bacterium]